MMPKIANKDTNMQIKTPLRLSPVVSRYLVVPCVLVFGFVATQPQANEIEAENPPRVSEAVSKSEENTKLFVWDRPSAFGKVPASLQPVGDFICAKGRIDMYATGYHSRAQDKDGQAIPGGGYFCEKKPTGDKPSSHAPRLTRLKGIVGWDQPSAFGILPEHSRQAGVIACNAMGQGLTPIGFHPDALDESGRKIRGGGYLCGPAHKS